MEDDSIVNLYWARSENAISETSKKYGNYCYSIAYGILGNMEAAELVQLIDSFVMSLSPMERRVFICRYWYFDPISEIAQRFGFSQSKVKMMLHRQRKNLLNRLEREEFL